jgi:enoyl-CoA hydratase/carnithine racemase
MSAAPSTSTGTLVDSTISDRLRIEVADGIARVHLARSEKYNGLDLPMIRALAAAPALIRADRSVRVVILDGDGEAFCAGLDFASVGRDPRGFARAGFKVPGGLNLFQRCCWAWRQLPVPVIAVLHGYCYGGGLQLALAADFRITTPDCQLAVLEGKWGLIPDMTGSVTLRELVGIDVAKRLTMTAETFSGERAHALGLVTEVSDSPQTAAAELATALAARSPEAISAAKALFQRTWSASPRRAFWIETVLQLRLLRGANHRIARDAGLRREQPVFRDRSR